MCLVIREDFDEAFIKAIEETTGCVVFETAHGSKTYVYEATLDEAWRVFKERNCTVVRASTEDEDTDL